MPETTLAQALLAFQAEGVKLQKDKINPAFKSKYLSDAALFTHVLPVLNASGIVAMQMPCLVEGVPSLTTRLIHAETGEHLEATMPLTIDKQGSQGFGAALTYARRYALMSMLGLVADEDTDGNVPVAKKGAREAPQPAQRAKAEDAPPANGAAQPAAGANFPPNVPPEMTKAQLGKLGVLVPKLRDDGVITTERLWAFVAKLRHIDLEPMIELLEGRDEDGVLRWGRLLPNKDDPGRTGILNRDEASKLIDKLVEIETTLEEAPFE